MRFVSLKIFRKNRLLKYPHENTSYKWFAWYPVYCENVPGWVWLEKVWCSWENEWKASLDNPGWMRIWTYTAPEKRKPEQSLV